MDIIRYFKIESGHTGRLVGNLMHPSMHRISVFKTLYSNKEMIRMIFLSK